MKVTVEFDVHEDTKFYFVTMDCMRYINGKWDYETFEKYTKDVKVIEQSINS